MFSQRTYIYITHRHRQQCVEGRGVRVAGKLAKRGDGDIYSSVNNKNKLKIIIIKPQLVKDFPQ